VAHIEVQHLTYTLPDGRVLLDDVGFRIGEGAVAALVGANGAGKSTLMRFISGEWKPDEGSVVCSGSMAIMPQFIGHMSEGTVRDLLLTVAPKAAKAAAAQIDAIELELMERNDDALNMKYAEAFSDWGDAGGYDLEVTWDVCTMAAMGLPFEKVHSRPVGTLSGGEQKRLVLEALLRGPDEILLLDEPDNYLDVPGKRWLEARLRESTKTVLLISHDRELLAAAATHIVAVELGAAGNTVWVHGGNFRTFHDARADRFARLEELRLRWDEKHQQLKDLVQNLKVKAAFNDGMSSRYRAACTRLEKYEQAGPPQAIPLRQNLKVRLKGGRTGKRAVVCENLELKNLTKAFDFEVWFGDRVAVLGGNGTGKSHLLRLLALGGSDPDVEHRPVQDLVIDAVAHSGSAKLGARVVPGWFAQTHIRPDLQGRTLLDILYRGDERRDGMPQEPAARALDRYELADASEQKYETLSGGQQARFQILLLELSGATLLLLDEPTDNLDIASADALQLGLDAFEGTVVAVTHDRWFAESFDRFLLVEADGTVRETDGPVWQGRG
jgi:ATPase subunit of ABC transporter with duplicated ATPase domains